MVFLEITFDHLRRNGGLNILEESEIISDLTRTQEIEQVISL